jgi:hypothetical protein
MIAMTPLRFEGKAPSQPIITVKTGKARIQFQPQLNDIIVGYRPDSKAAVLQALQQLKPKNLKDEGSFKYFRFQVNNGKATQKAWATVNQMISANQAPFASPMLKRVGTQESWVLKNQLAVVFKTRPSDQAIQAFAQKHQLTLVKANEYDPEYRFEAPPRNWEQGLKQLNDLHREPGVESALGNYLRFVPKPD